MNYLKFHRMSLGMTQADVAKRAKIAQATYCDYERGYRRPRPKHHKDLAEVLGRPIAEFTAKLYGVNASEMGAIPGPQTSAA